MAEMQSGYELGIAVIHVQFQEQTSRIAESYSMRTVMTDYRYLSEGSTTDAAEPIGVTRRVIGRHPPIGSTQAFEWPHPNLRNLRTIQSGRVSLVLTSSSAEAAPCRRRRVGHGRRNECVCSHRRRSARALAPPQPDVPPPPSPRANGRPDRPPPARPHDARGPRASVGRQRRA